MALLLQTQPLHKHSQPEAPHQTEQQPAPEPSKGLIAANAHALRNQGPQRLNQHLQPREGVIASLAVFFAGPVLWPLGTFNPAAAMLLVLGLVVQIKWG